MVYSKLTNQVKISSQSSSRNRATVDTFLIHHQAGTNDDAVIAAMVSGSKGVSANYTISNEGRITCVVPEELRAHTSGSLYDDGKGAAWDRRSITVEIENESGAPDWKISGRALQAAANLLNDLRARYTIKYVLGHRDLWSRWGASYPTFCPGPDTVHNIVTLATVEVQKEEKEEKAEHMGPKYIVFTEDPKNLHYAIVSTEIDGGFMRTQNIDVARTYATLRGNQEIVYCSTLATFENSLLLAATLHAQAAKNRGTVNVTLPPGTYPSAAEIATAINVDTAKRLAN